MGVEFRAYVLGILVGIVICLAANIILGTSPGAVGDKYEKKAVDAECGHYDPKDGEFVWGKPK